MKNMSVVYLAQASAVQDMARQDLLLGKKKTMNIKTAELTDLQSILELQKVCYQKNAERYDDYTIPPLIQTIDGLHDDYKNYLMGASNN